VLYGIGLQFTFAVCLWVALDLVRARGPRSQRVSFILLAVSCALWALGEMWVQAARSPETILLARRILWLGAALLPAAWVLTAATAAAAPWVKPQPWRAAIGAVPMLLCYSLLYLDPSGHFTSWTTPRPVHGFFFYVFVLLGWIQIGIGTLYFLQAAVRRHRAHPLRVVGIIAGAALPALGNAIHLLPNAPPVDLTPIFLGMGGLLIRFSILDSGLSSVLPMGRSDVLEQVPTGVLIADLDGRVIDSNRAARELLGEEPVEGHPLATAIGRARNLPGRNVEVETAPLHRSFGEAGTVALLTDRTEAARLERQLLQSQKLESLGLLAGGVAHDFNNLLTGILGNAHLALAELDPPHPARECLEEVIQASELAARLTGQMLAYSGRGRLDVRAVDLAREVRAIFALLQSSVSRNVQVVLDLGDDLPPVEADPAQVQQVILNLVINAAESIGDRAGVVRVSTGASELGADDLRVLVSGSSMANGLHAWIEVRDSGCGMDAATVGRMFDPFFSTKFTGRGLGLAAVLGIARGHRAGLRVQSDPGRGTTIRVYFPAGGGVVEEPIARAAMPILPGQGLVLVVDDEMIVRETARRALERAGFDVLSADSGRKAVELFRPRAGDIRLVLLDVTMPDASGLETFEELRRLEPALPILLSSGYTEESTANVCEGDALAGFVPKPYSPDELVRRVREMLESARS
jgi:signal transduction histidine kinase/CheY-like chemotaxis protein